MGPGEEGAHAAPRLRARPRNTTRATARRDGELVVLTNKLGEFRRLYDCAGGNAHADRRRLKFDVDAFDIDRRRQRVLYTVNENGFTRPRALDAKTLQADQAAGVPATPITSRFGATTPRRPLTTLGVDDGRRPLQGYVLDWKTGKLDAWHSPSAPEIDTARFARATLESYPARDGTKIPVFVRRPERRAPPRPAR